MKIKKDQSEHTQLYYDNFNKRDYLFSPTVRQTLRYKYAQAYLYSKQGKDMQSIEVANKVLNEAVAFKITKVELDCVELLAYLYKSMGDFENAHRMLERYQFLQKKDLNELQQIRLLALGAHYRYSELEREKLELKVKVQKSHFLTVAIILIFIFVISIVWLSLKKSKYKNEILKLKNIDIEDQISNVLLALGNQKNKNLELIQHELELKVQNNHSLKISEFINAINLKQITTWMEYESLFHDLLPGWTEKLKQKVPELTATDLKYCMCLYFDLNNFTVAKLCDTGVDGVRGAKKRIHNKFSLNNS